MSSRNSHNGSTPNGGKRNWFELPVEENERIARLYENGSAAAASEPPS